MKTYSLVLLLTAFSGLYVHAQELKNNYYEAHQARARQNRAESVKEASKQTTSINKWDAGGIAVIMSQYKRYQSSNLVRSYQYGHPISEIIKQAWELYNSPNEWDHSSNIRTARGLAINIGKLGVEVATNNCPKSCVRSFRNTGRCFAILKCGLFAYDLYQWQAGQITSHDLGRNVTSAGGCIGGSIIGSALAGAATGSIVPGPGTVAGAVIGVVGSAAGGLLGSYIAERLYAVFFPESVSKRVQTNLRPVVEKTETAKEQLVLPDDLSDAEIRAHIRIHYGLK